jgi:hypothetical protein
LSEIGVADLLDLAPGPDERPAVEREGERQCGLSVEGEFAK